jgi:(2R)-3-sulfolactate dehydrogenase (NADP+)
VSAPVTLSVLEIERLAERVLTAHGAGQASAAALARSIAAAERDGISSHGLAYLPTYCEHLHCGKVDGAALPSLERAALAVLTVDAKCGFAQPAIELGIRELCPLATTHGVAALAIRNSYNCGVLAHHTALIAAQGLVGIGFTNAPASIAPVGTSKPLLGTNPWSLAVPAGGAALGFVIDQSASVVAKSEVAKRARAKEEIPPGWALDAAGQPTTHPDAALKGSMVPSGGYKGVGAALLTEIMAACLTGAMLGVAAAPFSGPHGGPPRTGQFFLAIAPGPSSGGAFFERVAQLEHAFSVQPGAQLPGTRRAQARANSSQHGVSIDHALHSQIQQLLAQAPAPSATAVRSERPTANE